MIDFNFLIPADYYIYTITLRNEEIEGSQFVITSDLRHPDFAQDVDDLGKLLGSNSQYRLIDDFKNDLNAFLSLIREKQQPVDIQLLDDALIQICQDHINEYKRLMYLDLLMYVDIFIELDKAIFDSSINIYHEIYSRTVYLILNKFPTKVLFTNIMGTYSWADA